MREFEMRGDGGGTVRVLIDLGEVVAARARGAAPAGVAPGAGRAGPAERPAETELYLEGGFSFVVLADYEEIKALLSAD